MKVCEYKKCNNPLEGNQRKFCSKKCTDANYRSSEKYKNRKHEYYIKNIKAKKDSFDRVCRNDQCSVKFNTSSTIKVYCCTKCRDDHKGRLWRAEQRKAKGIKEVTCKNEYCDNVFMQVRVNHVFCSKDRCRRDLKGQMPLDVIRKERKRKLNKSSKAKAIKKPKEAIKDKKKYTLKETIKPKEKAVKKAEKVIETVNGGYEDNSNFLFNSKKKEHELVSRPYTDKERDMIEAFLAKA